MISAYMDRHGLAFALGREILPHFPVEMGEARVARLSGDYGFRRRRLPGRDGVFYLSSIP